ncbi:MAG TPA: hypothetical protein VFB50_10460 [Chloroflexota bacterium]|nr:hypothetical protein [Chloroflexota bacterium]
MSAPAVTTLQCAGCGVVRGAAVMTFIEPEHYKPRAMCPRCYDRWLDASLAYEGSDKVVDLDELTGQTQGQASVEAEPQVCIQLFALGSSRTTLFSLSTPP